MNIPDFNLPPIAAARRWPQQLTGVQAGRQLTSEQQHEFAEMLFRTVLQNPPHGASPFTPRARRGNAPPPAPTARICRKPASCCKPRLDALPCRMV